MSTSTPQNLGMTPQSSPVVEFSLKESKLEPFDQNYTLTGLIKDIQSSIGILITSKKNHQEMPPLEAHLEIQMLEKIQEEVLILKTIIVHNINQIFSSIYPSNAVSKSENRTNHTNSNRGKTQDENLNKSMTISDFDIDGNNKINALEVSKESLAYYQKRYAEQRENEHGLSDKKTRKNLEKVSSNHDKIRIQDEDSQIMIDLTCYEDEKTIINKRRYGEEFKDGNFSPISQRPIEEEYSMQKGAIQDRKENLQFNDKRIIFNPNRENLHVTILRQNQQIKKSLFGQKSQSFKRVSHRKFNYLQQLSQY